MINKFRLTAVMVFAFSALLVGGCAAEADARDFGVGAEFTIGIGLQPTVKVEQGDFTFQLGYLSQIDTLELEDGTVNMAGDFASLIAKYNFVDPVLGLNLYAGIGLLAASFALSASDGTVEVDIFDGLVTGEQAVFGINYAIDALPFPLILNGGLTYLNFSELEVDMFGVSASVPVSESGFTFHFGLTYPFSVGGENGTVSEDEAE